MKTQENVLSDELLKKVDSFLITSNKALADNKAMNDTIAFALEQWKTNKFWFCEKSRHVTMEDVIKICIEFAWVSKANFEYKYNLEKEK